MEAEEEGGPCPNCNQCQRESHCRGQRSTSRGNSASRRRERRRRRGAGSTSRHSHRSRSSRRSTNGSRPSSSRHGSRRSSPSRGGRTSPAAATLRRGGLSAAEIEARKVQTSAWPHRLSFMFAAMSALLGMFSMSRFAILTIDFGAVFLLQFLVLTLLFGVPMVTLFTSLGQYLGSGVIDMWRISPIFQGVGVSLLVLQGMLGIYSIVATSWMFVYFRDSFISVGQQYPWSCQSRQCQNVTTSDFSAISEYFYSRVLYRSDPEGSNPQNGLQYQVAFHLIVIWMIVFICLSKGVRSYGCVVYVFSPLAVLSFVAFAAKVLGDFPLSEFQTWLGEQDLSQFLRGHSNEEGWISSSWVCAAKECFLVWGLLGASLLQLAAHNKFNNNIKRDTSLTMLVVMLFLLLSGLMGVAIQQQTQKHGNEKYIPSSFESKDSSRFLQTIQKWPSGGRGVRGGRPDLHHISLTAGLRVIDKTRDQDEFSGYQVNRLATELIPAYLSIIGPGPAWSVLFYFTIILLGISQCLALFHTVIQGLIAIKPGSLKSWEGSITFSVCCIGLILGLPMATEKGVFVVYFLDYTVGVGWWAMILYLILIVVVLVVRGRPYGAEQLVTLIFKKGAFATGWCGPMLAFTWSVVLPLSLLIMSVLSFRASRVGEEMFDWTLNSGYLHRSVREIGSMVQLMPLLIVPFVAIIQTSRYFLDDTDTFRYRLEKLTRPSYSTHPRAARTRPQEVVLTNFTRERGAGSPSPPAPADPPPKYTPPPSYSTATGARIARFIRQSFRRSMHRLQGARPAVGAKDSDPPPPDYATVVIESTRHTESIRQNGRMEEVNRHNGVGRMEEDMYMDPLNALTTFEMISPATQNLGGAFSLDLGIVPLTRRDSNQSTLAAEGAGDQARHDHHQARNDLHQARHDHHQHQDLQLPQVHHERSDVRLARHQSLRDHRSGRWGPPEAARRAIEVAGRLERVDSQAVLVESAEPIYSDSGSELYSRSSSIINHSRQRSCPLTSDLNQPFNQSTNPLFNQSTNPLYNQSTNPLFNRPINQPLDQAINPVFNQHWFDQQPLIQPLRQPSNFSNQQPTTKSINQPQQHPANQQQQLLSNQDNLSFLESIRHDGSSRVQTRNEAPCGLTGNDATSNGGGKDFHILAPEDDFGEIVFVDTEEERVPEVQEEAVNITVITNTGTRRSLKSRRDHQEASRDRQEAIRDHQEASRDRQEATRASGEPVRGPTESTRDRTGVPRSREVVSINVDTSSSVI